MSATDEQLRVGTVVDPLEAVARLAGSGAFDEYVVYERPGEWIFAGGVVGAVELTTSRLRTFWRGDNLRDEQWTGRPAKVLEAALATLELDGRNAYGWVGFEFCAYTLGAEKHLGADQPIAHLMVPGIEVRVGDDGAVIIDGGSADEHETVRELLRSPAEPALPVPTGVDVRADRTDYRGRVATAIDEIRSGAYQKVILSRRFDIPFVVDVPRTYLLGRQHNTPARSYLLDLGGLQSAGFSPELVAAVDENGVVSTEPLAGTRAFGRGSAADQLARLELESDPKEIVEHAVSVRTSFAEIESVAEPGSTVVSDFMAVRERGSVQHLASTVQGTLSRGHTSWEALEALFPSVTASGIPKQESADAIFRLDDSARALYSGAVLTVSAGGALEATLVLRAVYQRDGQAWLRAGAGVIAQSNPEREFEETCEKLGSVAPYLVRGRRSAEPIR